jgi:glycosyltransferase involved in cell wall biosynthesis
MKIGIFTNAYKPIISGVVNSILLIRKGLTALGHRVYIFAPGYSGYRDREAGVFRFPSLNLTRKVRFPIALPYSPRLSRIIERVGLDVIHCHHPFVLGNVGARYARKLKIPLIFTFHTQYEQYSHYIPLPQEAVKRAARAAVKKYAGKCDSIICPSPAMLELLQDYGVDMAVEMLPNAIDIHKFKGRDGGRVRQKLGLEEDEKLLIYVGRMGVEKNLPFMLDSFRDALKEYPRARLMIVGEGPELSALTRMKDGMGLGGRVIFTGRVEYDEIPDYLAAAYAFIMTSTTEVKPLALLEAMASGLPVAAVSGVGIWDTVTHDRDGILTGEDRGEFTAALLRLLHDEALHDRMSLEARKTGEGYSMTGTAKKLESLYQKMISQKAEERQR